MLRSVPPESDVEIEDIFLVKKESINVHCY